MDIASMREILCKDSLSSSCISSERMIVHAFKQLKTLISTTPFTELTEEELNGKPTFIEELLLTFTSMNVAKVLGGTSSSVSSISSLTIHDFIQVISICVGRSLTESIQEYIHRKDIKDMLVQYIVETLMVTKAAKKEPLFADQLIFLEYISSLDFYIEVPEIAKAITIVICNDLETELLDPTGNCIDLDFTTEVDATPSSLWTQINRCRLNTALSVLHQTSKHPHGHQIAAEYGSSTLYRMQMQILHNRQELNFLITGEFSESNSVGKHIMRHVERDYDSGDEDDLLGLSPEKSKLKRPSMAHVYNTSADDTERNKVYLEELSKWLQMSIQAVFNLVSFNLYSFPYIISKPRSIASKKSDAVYGPDGKIISTTAQEDAAKGSSITVIDIKEITSALPSNDDQEQMLAILVLSSFYMSISPTLPMSLNGFGKACFPPDYMEKLGTLLSKSQSMSNKANDSSDSKKTTASVTPIKARNKNVNNKNNASIQKKTTVSTGKTGIYDILLNNIRTIEMLRPMTLTVNMTTLSSTGTIRMMVWFLLHEIEDIRFRTARIFREILNNPLRVEKKGTMGSTDSKKTMSQQDDIEFLEPEISVMTSAFIEQALIPILEIASKGISVTIKGSDNDDKMEQESNVQQFPEMYVRSVATDLLFCAASILESKDKIKTSSKEQLSTKLNPSSSRPPVMMRQRMLNTLLNTQNPKLRRNILISLLFLAARSSTLNAKIWEASRKINAAGPAGSLLREMLEGPLMGRNGVPLDVCDIITILAKMSTDALKFGGMSTKYNNKTEADLNECKQDAKQSQKSKLMGTGPIVMVRNSNFLLEKPLIQLGGKEATMVKMQCPIIPIIETHSLTLAKLLSQVDENYELFGSYEVWQQLFDHMVVLETMGGSIMTGGLDDSLNNMAIEVLLDVYELSMQFKMDSLSSMYRQKIIHRINVANFSKIFGYALRYEFTKANYLRSSLSRGRGEERRGGERKLEEAFIPPAWSLQSRYDLALCSECLMFMKDNIEQLFMPSVENPMRLQDCLNLLIEAIGSIFLLL